MSAITARSVLYTPRSSGGRLIRAELLKLRKRRGLVAWTLVLTSGAIVLQYGVWAALHAIDPAGIEPAGGAGSLVISTGVLANFGLLLSVIIGATVGTADVDAGVFGDLVATGQSRLALFTARVPGTLAFILPAIAVAYAIAAVASVNLAEPGFAPTRTFMLQGAAWVLLPTAVWCSVALGIASLVGSRAVAVGILLGWQFVAEPALALFGPFIGPWRHVALGAALTRVLPPLSAASTAAQATGPPAAVAAGVILLWIVVTLAAGAWRTCTRDA
ncbi:MAG: hypothetical protein ACRD0K_12830 [Egibacteraceae bacterium]